MSNLSIQLSRHGQTTRRPRWVVSIVALGLLLFIILACTTAWLNRSELLIAAPTGTEIAVELLTNPLNQKTIRSLFGHTPILSNRSIELTDLLPFTHGKLAMFVLNDGTTAVALRAKKNDLPKELLDNHHVVTQEVTKNVLLLSEKLQPISPTHLSKKKQRLIPRLWNKKLGIIAFPNEAIITDLLVNKEAVSFISSISYPSLERLPPIGTYGFLSTQVSPKLVEDLLNRFISSEQMSTLLTDDSWIFLTKNEEKEGFLVWTEYPKEFSRVELLKHIASQLEPILKPNQLQDGTSIQEIYLNPDQSSIEEITLLGRVFYRTKIKGGEEFYLSKDEDVIFSNNETNIRTYINSEEAEKSECTGNTAYLMLETYLQKEQDSLTAYKTSLTRSIAQIFSKFSMNRSGGNTIYRFCK